MNGPSIGLRRQRWNLMLLLSSALYGAFSGTVVEAQDMTVSQSPVLYPSPLAFRSLPLSLLLKTINPRKMDRVAPL